MRGTSPRASRTATSTFRTNRSARHSASRRGTCPPMDDGLAVGVDIGGTKVAFVLLDRGGAVLAEGRLQNDAFADAGELLDAIAREASELAAAAPVSVEGVGVGICELVGPDGEIGSSTTFAWIRADLENALSPIAPLTVDGDV